MDCGEIELNCSAFSSVKSLRILDLSECSIQKFPDSIGVLKQLRYLNAPRIKEATIPDSITKLSKLTYLNLHGSSAISALPDSIGDIEGLLFIDLSSCAEIEKLPESFQRLTKLVHLDLSHCSRVGDVSKFLVSFKELQYLNLSHCPNIGELAKELSGLSELQYLNLSFSSYLKCCQDVDVLGNLNKLHYLNLSSKDCSLKKLPEALGSFSELKYLNLSGCQKLKELPGLFGNFKKLLHLDLSYCRHINSGPEALSGLIKLQYLNLSSTGSYHQHFLKGLPEVIGNLTELRSLNLSKSMDHVSDIMCDDMTVVDSVNSLMCSISSLFNLEHLDLSNNDGIYSIPRSLCNLRKLQTLNLSYCCSLADIPESIGTIDSLKNLYLQGCYFLGELTQLSRNLISLPRFVVHASDGECSSNLLLLQHTDPVELEIAGLEKVKSAEEAQSIRLMEKGRLTDLKLEWGRDVKSIVDEKMLLEELEPPSTLKKLEIRGYNSVSFPPWVVSQLPKLESLDLLYMEHVEEWDTSYTSSEEYMFEELVICYCPKLKIKPLPPRAKHWKVTMSDNVLSSWEKCTTSQSDDWPSPPVTTKLTVKECAVPLHQCRLLHHLPCLTYLRINDCSDLTSSPEIMQCLTSVVTLCLEVNDQEELPQWLGGLLSIRDLLIRNYSGIKELHENMRRLTKLQELRLDRCGKIASLPHWLRELTSLTKLEIHDCDVIGSLPEGIQQLPSLQQKLDTDYYLEPDIIVESQEEKMKLTHNRERLCVLPTSLWKLVIWRCHGVRCLPAGMQQLTNLYRLTIGHCPKLKLVVELEEEKMKLTSNQERACVLPTSLKELTINGCDAIDTLPETNLQNLNIRSCPKLMKWCELEENKTKLAHIKYKFLSSISTTSNANGNFLGDLLVLPTQTVTTQGYMFRSG